ncbi:hypothetical protein ACF0H5_014752 [Mactra antiquata]
MFDMLEEKCGENGKPDRSVTTQELMTRSMLVRQTSDCEITVQRSYPRSIIILCIVVSIVIPILAPFVIYLLFKMKLRWDRGQYDRANRLLYCAIKVASGGVALFIIIGMISTLVISVLAYQKGSDISNFFDNKYEGLDFSNYVSKSMPLHRRVSTTVQTTEFKRTNARKSDFTTVSGNNNTKPTEFEWTNATKSNFTAVSVDNYSDNNTVSIFDEHPVTNAVTTTTTAATTVAEQMNMQDGKPISWKQRRVNSTHMILYNPKTGENRTSFFGYKLPND